MAGDRDRVAGAAVVQLPSVEELAIPVEQEQVGRAGRFVRLGDFLGLVKEERKLPALLNGEPLHVLGPVLRVALDAVGVDGHDRQPLGHVIGSHTPELVSDVDDERAVVADEHHEQRRCGVVILS